MCYCPFFCNLNSDKALAMSLVDCSIILCTHTDIYREADEHLEFRGKKYRRRPADELIRLQGSISIRDSRKSVMESLPEKKRKNYCHNKWKLKSVWA